MKKIGLVGGISWVSTIDYYTLINKGVNEKLGGLDFAECIIYSLNFGDIQRIGWDNSYHLLYGACKSLKRAGADVVVLCCNTAHFVAGELENKLGLPVIHIGTVTAEAIKEKGLTLVGLLGTKFTMEMDFYKNKLCDYKIRCIIPDSQGTRDFIQETLRNELAKGIIREETRKAYKAIIENLIARGAEGIILACTEIPLLISQQDVSVPVFDTTKIHSGAVVDYILTGLKK